MLCQSQACRVSLCFSILKGYKLDYLTNFMTLGVVSGMKWEHVPPHGGGIPPFPGLGNAVGGQSLKYHSKLEKGHQYPQSLQT